MRRLLVTLAVTAATAGCGQKGPLYLPDHNGTVITRPAPASAAPANAAPANTAPGQAADKKDTDRDAAGAAAQPRK